MKLKSKLIAAAIALVAASGAHAAVTTSSAGNGELFFTIYDQGANLSDAADDRAYVRDLGSLTNSFANLGGTLNTWASATTTSPLPALPASKQAFGTIYSIAADAGLSSFLAASTDTSRLKWNIASADGNGTTRILTTASSISAAQLPVLPVFRNFDGRVDSYLALMNPALTGESALYSGAGASIEQWGSGFKDVGTFNNTAGLGQSTQFFVLSERVSTGGTTTKADVRQYMADSTTAMQWTLANDGNLSYGATAVAAIPEPSEYALMLAGLGMLGFMARRRLNNRA